MTFFNGMPTDATATAVYDNLDRMRQTEVFLGMVPLASIEAMRRAMQAVGLDKANKILLYEQVMDSKSLFLTGNTDTTYAIGLLDLERDGPTVVEIPPGAGPGTVNDAYFRFVVDMGSPGRDRGKASNPPELEIVNGTGKVMNTIHANDFSFYEEIAEVIEREPVEFLDAELRENLAAIGIEKGKPFKPNEGMKRILTHGVAVGNATSRALAFRPRSETIKYYGPESAWFSAFDGGD